MSTPTPSSSSLSEQTSTDPYVRGPSVRPSSKRSFSEETGGFSAPSSSPGSSVLPTPTQTHPRPL